MEYITLQKATDFCSYSQEYLSLRARQGKLKTVKIGRNWHTTREWLQAYIEKAEGYKEMVRRKHPSREFDPPFNLPIESSDADVWEEGRPEEIAQQTAFLRKVQFATAFVMVLVLIGIGIFHGLGEFRVVTEELNPVVLSSAVALQEEAWKAGFTTGTFGAEFGGVVLEYIAWLRGL